MVVLQIKLLHVRDRGGGGGNLYTTSTIRCPPTRFSTIDRIWPNSTDIEYTAMYHFLDVFPPSKTYYRIPPDALCLFLQQKNRALDHRGGRTLH
ncbi:hypothetical protein ElyMa_002432400 [Elysia marginata]|uniref:Uncharacterized protein n=1 Tax=Elysia marginata TaxID=1093978 RepID=A0AAV4GGZ9_9GAST|nr:hypothetical protein ElyMa_002432400 [Elysia marginata]